MPTYDLNAVRDRILRELSGPGSSCGGCRNKWHTLRMESIQVPRHIVENLMREIQLVARKGSQGDCGEEVSKSHMARGWV